MTQIFHEGFDVIEKMLFQQEYNISFEKGGIYETKPLFATREIAILKDFNEVYYPIVRI